MTTRSIRVGALGWSAPALIALPFGAMRESAGGESALLAVIVWWALGAVGSAIAGAVLGATARDAHLHAEAFRGGLVGVSLAWIASVAVSAWIEAAVGVLHLGPLVVLIPVPFVIAYGCGFGLAMLATRGDP